MKDMKVRAWDKKSQKMREVASIVYWRTGDICSADQIGKVKLVQLVVQDCIEDKPILLTRESGEFELMEFIGLYDVNGKPIFEGDYVHWGHIQGATERTPRKAIVELQPDITFMTFNLGDCNYRFRFGSFAYRNTEKALEVIGNKHETPEVAKAYE